MSDLAKTVLSYIFPANRVAMEYAREKLTVDHFPELPKPQLSPERTFWALMDAYAERYNDIIPRKFLVDALERRQADPSKMVFYLELYDEYAAAEVTEAEFRYAVDGLIDSLATRKTGEAIAVSFEILERGATIDGELKRGHDAAREYFQRVASEVEESLVVEEAPEGDVNQESDKFLQKYFDIANGERETGILTGIRPLDESTGGLGPGELCVFAAFMNDGKTQFVTQWAWHAAIKQGKNVFFATTETVRDQVWRRYIARHSREPQFEVPGGLNVRDIKDGTLSPDHVEVLRAVLDDLRNNSDYGKFHISQVPGRGGLDFIESRMYRQQRLWNIEFVVMDYLALLKPDSKRANEREEFNDIFRRTKKLITSFDHGRGVPFVSPWQMSRDAYNRAKEINAYVTASLSDTSESEKSADWVLSLLRPSNTSHEALLQVLKMRDAAIMDPLPVHLDYRNAYIGETPSLVHREGGGAPAFGLASVLG